MLPGVFSEITAKVHKEISLSVLGRISPEVALGTPPEVSLRISLVVP